MSADIKTIGEVLREARKASGLFLREVATELDVDPSFLSKIEKGDKRPTRVQVIKLAGILKADKQKLLITFLSDKVAYELEGEELVNKVMRVAEAKIDYLKQRKLTNG
jgi:transcriptional regulator with XRE-family HTH domain